MAYLELDAETAVPAQAEPPAMSDRPDQEEARHPTPRPVSLYHAFRSVPRAA